MGNQGGAPILRLVEKLAKFFQELNRRRVLRAAVSYLVVAWLVVQVISVIGPALGLTERFMQYALIVLAVGFPIAMTLSWFFAFSLSGIARESAEAETPVSIDGRNLDFVIIGVLATALVGALVYIGATNEPETSRTSVLAVLPLTNITSNTPDNGFVDGLHDDLLGTLSQLSPLQVISRTSVLGFRNTTIPVREIGSKLGADKIIEGSIQLANNMIRISLRLVDVESDSPIWTNTYEREFNATQLFRLQRDIALSVADELKVALALSENERLQSLPTQSTEAYRLYLLGKLRTADRNSAALGEAVKALKQAIELDPQYAEAYAALALAQNLQYSYSNVTREDMVASTMPLVQRALELDANLSDAHVVLADLRSLNNDVQGAETAYQDALKFNPNSALAHHWYGILLLNDGRFKEALEQHKKAQDLDPLSPIISVNIAQDYTYLGDTEAALKEYTRTLEIKPDFVPAYAHMAALYSRSLKRPDEAVTWLRKAWEMDSGHTEYASQLAETLLDLGDPESALAWADLAFELGPTQYWPNRAQLYHALYIGDEALIERYTQSMLDFVPGQFDALLARSERLIVNGKADEAKQLFLPALAALMQNPPEVDTGNYAHAIVFAYVLQANDEHEQAEQILNRALSVMKDEPRIGFRGKQLLDVAALSLLNRGDDAVDTLNQALDSKWSAHWWSIRYQPLFANIQDRVEVGAFDQAMQKYMKDLHASIEEKAMP